jgi:hypothetical protein
MFPVQNIGQVGRWVDILADDLTLWPGRYQPTSTGKLGPFRSLDTAKTRAGRRRPVHFLASTRTGIAAAEKKNHDSADSQNIETFWASSGVVLAALVVP